jgi:hypothetical protein
MIILVATVVAGALYLALRLPIKTNVMTEEEYRQYFCTHIMGMK